MELYSIVKSWPFKRWAMDFIEKIYPASSKGHNFILVAIDYFTKWVDAVPLKKVEQKNVIQFMKKQIIHRFGILHSIKIDQGTMFIGDEIAYLPRTVEFNSSYLLPFMPKKIGR